MESTAVNIVFHHLLNYKFQVTLPAIEGGVYIQMNLNPGTLIRNIPQVIMNKIGLEYLASCSEAYIQVPPSNSFVNRSSFPDKNINIGTIKAWMNCHPTIKIIITSESKGSVKPESMNTINYNPHQFLINNYTISQNDLMNPFIKSFFDGVNNFLAVPLQYSNLLSLNEITEKVLQNYKIRELEATDYMRMFNNDQAAEDNGNLLQLCSNNSTLSSLINKEIISFLQTTSGTPYTNINEVQLLPFTNNLLDSTFKTRRKIKFDTKKEIPILENWYKTIKYPKSDQLKEFAGYLNYTSNRSLDSRITLENLKYWFSYRRVKEKKNRKH
uniref:Homeobox domain-containing protein n=1 Tax=Strongyloides venezuelensis TaxID=75913 RepID=A0A0K0FL59_STRVS